MLSPPLLSATCVCSLGSLGDHQGAFLLSTCIPLSWSQALNGSEFPWRVKWGYTIALYIIKDSRLFYGSDSSDNGITGIVSRKDIWTQLDTCPRAQVKRCKPKQWDASRHGSRLASGVAGGETSSQHWQWCPESTHMSMGARTHIC